MRKASPGAFLCVLASLWLAPAPAQGRPALVPFPEELMLDYAGTLARGELAVVDNREGDRMPQITLLGYAEAPPEVVHGLVADPTLYPRYVRNLKQSDVVRQPDGALRNEWKVVYPIGSFAGTDELRFEKGSAGRPGRIDIRSLGAGKQGVARWEFLPAPGGGTVVVNYGCYDPLDNAILRAMIGDNPELDAGFNLAGALTVMRSLLAEARREAQRRGLRVAAPRDPGKVDFAPLLERGTVAVVRTGPDGALIDVSVAERIPAPLPVLRELVQHPETWPGFLRSVRSVRVLARDARTVDYRMTVRGVIFDVEMDYRTLLLPAGADTLALSGMMKGARYRWDLDRDGESRSMALWRGNLHLGDSSRIMRALFRMEPSFEHSANISVGLISVRAMARQARLMARGG